MVNDRIIFSEEVEFDSTFPDLTFSDNAPVRIKEVQVWRSAPTPDNIESLPSVDPPVIEEPIDPNAKYISATGEDTNDGSKNSPWKTLKHALTGKRLSPGNTLVLQSNLEFDTERIPIVLGEGTGDLVIDLKEFTLTTVSTVPHLLQIPEGTFILKNGNIEIDHAVSQGLFRTYKNAHAKLDNITLSGKGNLAGIIFDNANVSGELTLKNSRLDKPGSLYHAGTKPGGSIKVNLDNSIFKEATNLFTGGGPIAVTVTSTGRNIFHGFKYSGLSSAFIYYSNDTTTPNKSTWDIDLHDAIFIEGDGTNVGSNIFYAVDAASGRGNWLDNFESKFKNNIIYNYNEDYYDANNKSAYYYNRAFNGTTAPIKIDHSNKWRKPFATEPQSWDDYKSILSSWDEPEYKDAAIIGDSISWGQGASPITEGCNHKLAILDSEKSILSNQQAGMPGLEIGGLRIWADRVLSKYKVKYVVVQIGANNYKSSGAYESASASVLADHAINTLEMIAARGSIPIWIGAGAVENGNTVKAEAVNNIIKVKCQEKNWIYLPWLDEMKRSSDWQTKYYANIASNIHPNNAGHLLIAGVSKDAIDQASGGGPINLDNVLVPTNKPTLQEALNVVNAGKKITLVGPGPFEHNGGITKKVDIVSTDNSTIVTSNDTAYGLGIRAGASGSTYQGLVIDGGKNARVTTFANTTATFKDLNIQPDTTTSSANYAYLVQKDSVANIIGGEINTREYAIRVMGGGTATIDGATIRTTNAGNTVRHLWCETNLPNSSLTVKNSTIHSGTSTSSIEQITTAAVASGHLTAENNTIYHPKPHGHTIGVGSEVSVPGGDNNITYRITGNTIHAFKGTNEDIAGTIHSIFIGHNKDGIVDKNTVIGGGYAYTWKGTNTSNSTGYLAKNIAVNANIGLRLKGVDNAKIVNNTFIAKGTNAVAAFHVSDNDNTGSSNGVVSANNIFVNLSTRYVAIIASDNVSFTSSGNNVYICNGLDSFSIGSKAKTFAEWIEFTNETNSICLVKIDTGFDVYHSSKPTTKWYSIVATNLVDGDTGKLVDGITQNPLVKNGRSINGITETTETDIFGNHFGTKANIGADQTPVSTTALPPLDNPIVIIPDEETLTNLALNILPTVDPRPAYGLVTLGGDADIKKITDGIYTPHSFWMSASKPFTAGFTTNKPITISLDLGKPCEIHEIRVNTCRGIASGVFFPLKIDVYASVDDAKYYYVGDVMEGHDNAPGEYLVKRFETKFSSQPARYVTLFVLPGGYSFFTDEIEILGKDLVIPVDTIGNINKADLNDTYLKFVHEYQKQVASYKFLKSRFDNIQNVNDVQDIVNTTLIKLKQLYQQNAARCRTLFGETITAWTTPIYHDFSPVDSPIISNAYLPPSSGINETDKNKALVSSMSVEPVDETTVDTISLDTLRKLIVPIEIFMLKGTTGHSGFNLISSLLVDTNITITPNISQEVNPFITVRWVKNIDSRNNKLLTDPVMQSNNRPVLEPGVATQYMVTAMSPPVGTHTGSIDITSSNGISISIPILIKVVDLELDRSKLPDTCAWSYTSWPIMENRLDVCMLDMKAHYINVGIINQHHLPAPTPTSDILNPNDIEIYKKDLQYFKNMKYLQIYFNVKNGKNMSIFGDYKADLAGWSTRFKKWITTLYSIAEQQGIDPKKILFYPVDEPREDENLHRMIAISNAIKSINPEYKLYTTYDEPTSVTITASLYEQMVDCYDIIQLLDSRVETKPFLIETIKAKGKECWIYVTSGGKTANTLEHYRKIGWLGAKHDAKGIGFWCYAATATYGSDEWDDYDGRGSDWTVVYGDTDGTLLTSKRWEGWREGVEDYTLIAMARDKGLTPEEEAYLSNKINHLLVYPLDTKTLNYLREWLVNIIMNR